MALPAHAPIAVVVYDDERLCVDPRWGSKEVSGDLAGMRGARNGDYRILVTIDDHKRVVWLRLVSHLTHLREVRSVAGIPSDHAIAELYEMLIRNPVDDTRNVAQTLGLDYEQSPTGIGGATWRCGSVATRWRRRNRCARLPR